MENPFSHNGTHVSEDPKTSPAHESAVVRGFDRVTQAVRQATPAWVVNNGSRINFALKALADSMSIASSIRRGSEAPARLIANSITLASLIPGSLYEEKGISEAEDHAERKLSPLAYVGRRLSYALNPRDHVVETVGVATILNGALTIASGAAQSSKRQLSWELVTGAFTMAAGGALTFLHDRQRAWQGWTAIFLGRTPFKVMQSEQAWNRGYTDRGIQPGDKYQGMNLAVQLVGNVFSTFYGGVKKLPDGTIVHLGSPREQPSQHAHLHEQPHTTLTTVSTHARALGEPPMTMEVA